VAKSKAKKSRRHKPKRPLTPAQRARRRNTMIIFVHGKQKRVPRPPTIDGLPVEEFIRRNADPIWLHQNEMWEYMTEFNGACEPTLSRLDHAEDAPPPRPEKPEPMGATPDHLVRDE